MLRVVQDFRALTMRASLLDNLSAATTFGTGDLRLREHAGENLLSDNLDTSATAGRTSVNIVCRRSSGTSTMITEDTFLDHEL